MTIDLSPGARIGRFVVTRALGEGGMGTVVEARDPELGRSIALKLLRDEQGDTVRLLREAQALATLSHPNVVTVHELGTAGGEVFIAMELVDGVTLDRVLAERPHTWSEVLALFVQAGRGLAAVHERGMVHRDFKPSNVFVDRAGRVRVGDFGLACRDLGPSDPAAQPGVARALASTDGSRTTVDSDPHGAAAGPALTPGGSGALAAQLTRTGAVMGTPRYMAPEQRAGLRATHRTDQYAFCLSLHEALVGHEPGAVTGKIPPWLRSIVDRGLTAEPADRHPSMLALLSAIERGHRRRHRRRLIAAVGAVTIVAAGTAFWVGSRGPDPRQVAEAACAASASQLGGAWDATKRADVARAFAASDRAHASETGPQVGALLDRYADLWSAARVQACRDTHVARTQSEALLDLRVQCLDRRRDELAALAGALASPLEPTTVDQAASVAYRLARVDDCAHAEQVQLSAPMPADPEDRAHVEQTQRALTEVMTQYRLGRAAVAQTQLAAVVAQAGDLRHPPLQSELAFVRGWFAYRAGKAADAEAAMGEALRFAAVARDLRREERAWLGLFMVVSSTAARKAEAEQLLRANEMALERAGRPVAEWADHRNYVVLFHMNTGRLEEAERVARATVAEVPPDRFWQRGVALDQHARVLAMLHRRDETIVVGREALALWERALGARHPKLANPLASLSRAYRGQGRLEEAEAALRRSLDLLIAAHGAGSVHLADTYKELARVAAARRDLAGTRQAAAAMLRALAPLETTDPENWINGQNQAGGALADAGAPDEALPYLRRALERATAIGDHKDAAIARLYLGETLNLLRQPREALAHCTAAEAPMTERLGASGRNAVWHCRGDALVALGRTAEAVALLEPTVASVADNEPGPGELAEVRFALARAHWAHGNRVPALALADQAAAEWTGPRFAHDRAAVETWRRGVTGAR